MTAVTALLYGSLIIGPVVTGSFWAGAHFFTDAPDGMARLNIFVGFVVFSVVSFSAAYWIAILAILIQIWRDQWHKRLTVAAIAFLYILFVASGWIITNSTK